MAVAGPDESHAIDREELRRGVVTSSTKRRITELAHLEHKFAQDGRTHFRAHIAFQ